MNFNPTPADAVKLDKITADIKRISDWRDKKVTVWDKWAKDKNAPKATAHAQKQIIGANSWAEGKIQELRGEYSKIAQTYVNQADSSEVAKIVQQAANRAAGANLNSYDNQPIMVGGRLNADFYAGLPSQG